MKKRLKIKKIPLIILGFIIVLSITGIILYNNYINSLPYRLAHTEDYIEERLDRYQSYLNDNEIDSLDEVIFLVNEDVDQIEGIKYSKDYINIFDSKYYIAKNKERYLKYLNGNPTSTISHTISAVNANVDKQFFSTDYKTDTSKEFLMLVNKYYVLDEDYVPTKLVSVAKRYGYSREMDETAYNAMVLMFKAALASGVEFMVTSPYRSYSTQATLYSNYSKQYGATQADTFCARAGYSEHQTGLAMDIVSVTSPKSNFEDTKEYEWLVNNGYKFGFILRYPEGKEDITGYNFESWHYRYVGIEAATYIYENNITLEEYYEYFVK